MLFRWIFSYAVIPIRCNRSSIKVCRTREILFWLLSKAKKNKIIFTTMMTKGKMPVTKRLHPSRFIATPKKRELQGPLLKIAV
jgi:hypothetical protein